MNWDLNQTGNIGSVQIQAERALDKAERHGDDIASLKRSVERLTLASQAMWELIRGQTSITEKMLDAKMEEIDMRDGTKDGRISASLTVCPACGAKSNSRRDTCIMCGAHIPRKHAFEG